VKIYVAAVEARAQEEGRKEGRKEGDETQFCTKIGGGKKLVFGSQLLRKISFPVTHLMPYYAETGRSRHPPDRLTIQVTLLAQQNETRAHGLTN